MSTVSVLGGVVFARSLTAGSLEKWHPGMGDSELGNHFEVP